MISLDKWMILHLYKICLTMWAITGFEWLPKVQKIAQSDHTARRRRARKSYAHQSSSWYLLGTKHFPRAEVNNCVCAYKSRKQTIQPINPSARRFQSNTTSPFLFLANTFCNFYCIIWSRPVFLKSFCVCLPLPLLALGKKFILFFLKDDVRGEKVCLCQILTHHVICFADFTNSWQFFRPPSSYISHVLSIILSYDLCTLFCLILSSFSQVWLHLVIHLGGQIGCIGVWTGIFVVTRLLLLYPRVAMTWAQLFVSLLSISFFLSFSYCHFSTFHFSFSLHFCSSFQFISLSNISLSLSVIAVSFCI